MSELQRLPGVQRGPALRFTFDDQTIEAHPGETVGAALWAAGIRKLYCGMGVCHVCLVRQNGHPQRACMLLAKEGMELSSEPAQLQQLLQQEDV